MKFGEFLILCKYISKGKVDEALNLQKYNKTLLGRLLVELGELSKENLNKALFEFLRPLFNLDIKETRKELLLKTFDLEIIKLAKKYNALPLLVTYDKVKFIGTSFRDELIKEAQDLLSKKIVLYVTDVKTFGFLESKEKTSKKTFEISSSFSEDERLFSNANAFIEIFRSCIEEAKKRCASDIHIEPKEKELLIRFRINGDLIVWKKLAKEHTNSLIATIKLITNLDLAVIGSPQDSRASFNNFSLDIRANSLPTIYGEKIVLRLLDMERDFNIDKIGFDEKDLIALKNAVNKKSGLLIISGPTGSGKTTTLYSLLNSIDSKIKNISTLENPVEYRLPGITQIDIGKNLTFSKSLKALMRQDPDVILVGEIRDEESAELCFKAAETGHLVLSTLHANGAKEVVERLINLGVNKYTIKNNLKFSAAQRLVKRICPRCGVPASLETTRKAASLLNEKNIPIINNFSFKIQNRSGCINCENGVLERIPVLEYINEKNINLLINSEVVNVKSISERISTLAAKGIVCLEEIMEFI